MIVPRVLQGQVGQLQYLLVLADELVLVLVPLVGQQLVALPLALKLHRPTEAALGGHRLFADHQTTSLRTKKYFLAREIIV